MIDGRSAAMSVNEAYPAPASSTANPKTELAQLADLALQGYDVRDRLLLRALERDGLWREAVLRDEVGEGSCLEPGIEQARGREVDGDRHRLRKLDVRVVRLR